MSTFFIFHPVGRRILCLRIFFSLSKTLHHTGCIDGTSCSISVLLSGRTFCCPDACAWLWHRRSMASDDLYSSRDSMTSQTLSHCVFSARFVWKLQGRCSFNANQIFYSRSVCRYSSFQSSLILPHIYGEGTLLLHVKMVMRIKSWHDGFWHALYGAIYTDGQDAIFLLLMNRHFECNGMNYFCWALFKIVCTNTLCIKRNQQNPYPS